MTELLDTEALRRRGWTERMIKQLLGEPDDWYPVNYWANWTGKRVYLSARVKAVESTEDFRARFIASTKRRNLEANKIRSVLARSRRLAREGALAEWEGSRGSQRSARKPVMVDPRDPLLAGFRKASQTDPDFLTRLLELVPAPTVRPEDPERDMEDRTSPGLPDYAAAAAQVALSHGFTPEQIAAAITKSDAEALKGTVGDRKLTG